MRLDSRELDNYDYVFEVPAEDKDDKIAKFYFRGTRDWLWDILSKLNKGNLQLSFKEQYEFLVRIMVKWENLFDSSTNNLPIPFSTERALLILQNFEIIPQDKLIKILIEVFNKVQERETYLKNLLAGSTPLDDSAQDGSKSVLTSSTIQAGDAKHVKKKRVKK